MMSGKPLYLWVRDKQGQLHQVERPPFLAKASAIQIKATGCPEGPGACFCHLFRLDYEILKAEYLLPKQDEADMILWIQERRN